MKENNKKPATELLYTVMCRVLLLFLFFSTTGHLFAQEKTIEKGSQQWFQYYNQLKLSNKLTALTDAGFRWKDGFNERSQYLVRTGIGYSINSAIRVAAGIAHFEGYSNTELAVVEFRLYKELVIQNVFPVIRLNHRIRVEERFYNAVTDGKIQTPGWFNFRFRYRFMVAIPLFKLSKTNPDKMVKISVGDEIFLNAGKHIVTNIFDQNRIFVSPSVHFNKNLSLSLTWNSMFSGTSEPGNYKYQQVFWIQLKHKIDITGNKK